MPQNPGNQCRLLDTGNHPQRAALSYSLPANGAEGDIAITRVIAGGQALCEELLGVK
jgi:hypothetical protein